MESGDENDFIEMKKSIKKKSGGFQSMGLSYPVLKGILKRGYQMPTPIQRKTIPIALESRDIVAMARTGSGKTACFLIPLFEKLKTRQAKSGSRAIVLSPTRELAIQTLTFIKELGKFTGLQASLIVGGDSMDNQFSIMHGNPDIIVATPGRFLHICVEMELNLKSVEFVVFDEADRLFEMGFGEQIHEIINRLPENRQTLLYSATLPKLLVEFTKAGLRDPVLLRLDVESKLPEALKLCFITCRPEEKLAVLLYLLKHALQEKSQVVVFAATMHHVEYIHMILDKVNISNTFIYSNLDATARKINASKFQNKKARVLVVTDIAARGIDIPYLDYVINYNFPAKSKLFVHRVGRCARAGRSGTAYNIVSADEYAYLLDLHMFLGRPLNLVPTNPNEKIPEESVGKIPQTLIEEELSELIGLHNQSTDLTNMQQVCKNGYQQYLRSRPAASTDSIKRIKDINISTAGILPEFKENNSETIDFLARMKNYRPPGTVFEIVAKPSSVDYKVMKEKRAFHKNHILNHHKNLEEKKALQNKLNKENNVKLQASTSEEINEAFTEVIVPKKRKIDDLYKLEKKKKQKVLKDDEFFIPYNAPDHTTEEGLAVNNYSTEVDKAQIELMGDNEESRKLHSQIKRWDRKKKKMITINNDSKTGKIKTESGIWIPATYKSNRYKEWKEKSKVDANEESEDEEQSLLSNKNKKLNTAPRTHWARYNEKLKQKNKVKSELKRPEQILKARKLMEKKKKRNAKKKGSRNKGSRNRRR